MVPCLFLAGYSALREGSRPPFPCSLPQPHCVCPFATTASSSPPAELLVTEAAHVRMLRVLHDLFYQPMADGGFFPLEELQNIFPSLDELIEVHCECGPPPRTQPGLRSSHCGITSTSTARGGPHGLDPAGLIRSCPVLHVQYAPHLPSAPRPQPYSSIAW